MRTALSDKRLEDVALALAVGAVQIVATVFASQHQDDRATLDVLGIALLAAGPLSLAARRRHPVPVLGVVFGTTLLYWVLDYPRGPIFLALIVAFFTAALRGHRRIALLSIFAGWASFLWLGWLIGTEPSPKLGQAVGLGAWLLVLAAAAEIARVRREGAAERGRAREEEARHRADEERLRIARELHDVLAHNVSLINVQSGVALHLMDERPEQARTALAAIKQASGETLRELRSVLGVLRQVPRPPRLARLSSGAAPATSRRRSPRSAARARPASHPWRTPSAGGPRRHPRR